MSFRFSSYSSYDRYSLQSSPRTDRKIGPYATSYQGNISLAEGLHIHTQRPALYIFQNYSKNYNIILHTEESLP